jgi:hypothetical protein
VIANALLVRWSDGFIEVVDATSIAAIGRREAFLSAGNAPSVDEATRIAEAVLFQYATEQEEITAAVEPIDDDDQPYVAFAVGDAITVPDSSGTPVFRRVVGLTVTEDDDGDLTYAPELKP